MFQKFKTWALALPVATFGAVGAAQAAVPADVTTALADLQTDAVTVATTVLVAIISVFAIKFIRKGI